MLRLMLLRHAKSDRSAIDAPDHERMLNQRGRTAATRIGAYLADESLLPTLVLCSTATRTRETCERIVAAFPHRPAIRFERRLYLATPEAVINLVATTPGNKRSLLVIGHNPGMHIAAQTLASAGNSKVRAQLQEKFPTAAVAVIDFDIASWAGVTSHEGHLERFVTPKEIMRTD
ncbi:MAG: SixA phosphatase family protein [Xanthobacteraceae bacterium]